MISFMESDVSDDLLLEIFIRLQDARTAIQSAAVCKRWQSLIMNPYFIGMFTKHHSNHYRETEQFEIVFNYTLVSDRVPFNKLSLNDYESRPYDLSFFPKIYSSRLIIRAACDDLLLISLGRREYFVCNLLTKDWIALPEIPRAGNFKYGMCFDTTGGHGYGIVRHPNRSEPNCYRVVLVYHTGFLVNKFRFSITVFDSETGLWDCDRHLSCPFDLPRLNIEYTSYLQTAVTSGGVLHWLDGFAKFVGLAALDVFTSEWRMIPLPPEFKGLSRVNSSYIPRLGAVRGHLRLSRIFNVNDSFGLRIWELNCDDSWRLVHDATLELKRNKKRRPSFVAVLDFDPDDGDVMVLVRDDEILRYQIGSRKYDRVCKLPLSHGRCFQDIQRDFDDLLIVHTVTHPLWPTPTSLFRN